MPKLATNNIQENTESIKNEIYCGTFKNCYSLTDINDSLYNINIGANTFKEMFKGCTALKSVPSDLLPSVSLWSSCYESMFEGCISLSSIPVLPAQVLKSYCYKNMFKDCISLQTVSDVLFKSITTMETGACNGMFINTGLKTAPELPIVNKIPEFAYYEMFKDCKKLINSPKELPVIELSNYCYEGMFRNCISLQSTPKLPAIIMKKSCYQLMFENCSSLIIPPELPATK